MDPVSVYINWIMFAIYGRMADADALRRMHGDAIDAVAGFLARKFPIPSTPLYRGMLLDPAGTVRPEPNLTFLSWSLDRDVARWFASPGSYISEPFVERYPEVCGFVMTLAHPARVLWHPSWRDAFSENPLEQLALQHPSIREQGARQIAWSLDTQAEVITATFPLDELPARVPVDDVPGATVSDLDQRLTPSWVNVGAFRFTA